MQPATRNVMENAACDNFSMVLPENQLGRETYNAAENNEEQFPTPVVKRATNAHASITATSVAAVSS
jgi:hypothetical protein